MKLRRRFCLHGACGLLRLPQVVTRDSRKRSEALTYTRRSSLRFVFEHRRRTQISRSSLLFAARQQRGSLVFGQLTPASGPFLLL
jgi:hypothetical protein